MMNKNDETTTYVCNGCGKPLEKGSDAILFHIRNGKVLGHAEGTYAEDGTIIEDPIFKRDNNTQNSKRAVIDSELNALDSQFLLAMMFTTLEKINTEELRTYDKNIVNKKMYQCTLISEGISLEDSKWDELPLYDGRLKGSGIGAWHTSCYNKDTDDEGKISTQLELIPLMNMRLRLSDLGID